MADLPLTSGEAALAIFKVVVTTCVSDYALGKISQGDVIVAFTEAERLWVVKGCGVWPPSNA